MRGQVSQKIAEARHLGFVPGGRNFHSKKKIYLLDVIGSSNCYLTLIQCSAVVPCDKIRVANNDYHLNRKHILFKTTENNRWSCYDSMRLIFRTAA
jgi:hypothetical protein